MMSPHFKSATCKMYIEDIQVLCRRVLRGDKEASQRLGLNDLQYPEPTPYNLSNDSLQATYTQVLHTAAAAGELSLSFFEKQCNLTLELLKAIALAKGVNLKHELDTQDLAEVMLALIHDEVQRHHYKEVPEGHSEEELQDQPDENEQEQELAKSAAKEDQPKTPSQARSPTAPTKEQLPSTSTAQPSKPAEAQLHSTSTAPEKSIQPATPVKKQLPSSSSIAQEKPAQPTSTATEKSIKPAKPVKKQLPSSSSTAQEKPAQPTSTAPLLPHQLIKPADDQATESSRSSSTKSNKNKRRQCLLCPFYGTHLDRHIAAKHPDAARSKPERVMLIQSHDKLSRAKGKKEVRHYQCMYKKCGAIITRLGQHLTWIHKITDKDQLKTIKKTCKRLPLLSLHQAKKNKRPIKVSFKKKPKRRRRNKSDHSSSSSSDDESFTSDGSTSNEHQEIDHHQLKVDADVDDISSFAETDEDQEGPISSTDQKKNRPGLSC